MRQEHPFDEHMRFLQELGTALRLYDLGFTEKPAPQNIKLMLLDMKRAERERDQK